jgi:TRAP transporter TAXI family solute receptor
LKDGQLDAFGGGGAPPNARLIDLARVRDIVYLKMDQDVISNMAQKYGYVPAKIKADTYDFLEEDYETFSATVVIAVAADMPDDVAYLIAKAMYENREYLGTVHSAANRHMVDVPDGIIAGIPELAPVHPGAAKYYREVGLMK